MSMSGAKRDAVFAKSLFQIGVAGNVLDEVLEDYRAFLALFEGDVGGLAGLLCGCALTPQQKKRLLSRALQDVFCQELLIFVGLVVERSLGKRLRNIFLLYQGMVDAHLQRVRTTVYSVCELEKSVLRDLQKVLQERFQRAFILHCVLDESILGGLVICFEGRRIDLSLRCHLEALSRNIVKSRFQEVL